MRKSLFVAMILFFASISVSAMSMSLNTFTKQLEHIYIQKGCPITILGEGLKVDAIADSNACMWVVYKPACEERIHIVFSQMPELFHELPLPSYLKEETPPICGVGYLGEKEFSFSIREGLEEIFIQQPHFNVLMAALLEDVVIYLHRGETQEAERRIMKVRNSILPIPLK